MKSTTSSFCGARLKRSANFSITLQMRYIEYESVSMSSRSSPVMNVLTSSSLICSVMRLSLSRARANSCSGCGWLRSFSNSTSRRVKAWVSSALASSRSKNFASWLKYFWTENMALARGFSLNRRYRKVAEE